MIRKLRTERETTVNGYMDSRMAYVTQNGDGPFGDCEWKPPVGRGQAYF